LDPAQGLSFIILLAINPIIAWQPELREMLGLTEWQIAAGSFGIIIASRLILAPYWAYREAADLVPGRINVRPDMRIDEATDYIVNDSTTILRAPARPKIIEHGPRAGFLMTEKGVEHEDARRLLNNELISGNLRCWGRRPMDVPITNQFEETLREIEKSYWNDMRLNYFTCHHHTENFGHTLFLVSKNP
jgi:hypothetical protein